MLSEFGKAWWNEARKKMKNAVIFLDPVSCECLHWNGGAPFILEAGAISVKEFSSFEVVHPTTKKAVFIVNSAFHGTNYNILRSLIKPSNLEYCVIITTAHVSIHDYLRGFRETNETDSFQILEEDILKWMGNMNYTVEIFNYPLSTVHPTRDSFLIPSARSVSPLLLSDLPAINEQLLQSQNKVEVIRSVNDVTFSHLPLNCQAEIRQLVHNLHQLLLHINGKEEIFTVGSYSRIIGTELDGLNAAKTRRKSAQNRVSVIVVDRVLDLVGATALTSQSLFDQLLHTLDRYNEYSNDVAFSMNDKEAVDLTLAPGTLAPESDWARGWDLMDQLFYRDPSQAEERITVDLNRETGGNELDLPSVLERHQTDWELIEKCTHLFQVGKAVAWSKRNQRSQRIHYLIEIQKNLTDLLEDENSPSPLIQILQIVKTRKDANLSLDDILVLMIHLYSLSDDQDIFTPELEDRFKSLFAENLVSDCDNLSEATKEFVGVPVDEVKAHRVSNKIMEFLHSISVARSNMKKYHSLHSRSGPALPLKYNSLFQQLIEDIFDPAVGENPDIEHKSGGLKDLLKTGFSLFVNVRKPKASDNPTILLYVCGGIRPDEIKLIRDLVEEKSPSHRLIVGSSHFCSAHDVVDCVLKKRL